MNLFLQIAKVDQAKRLVYGTAAVEQVDKSGEIFDYDSSKPHFEHWSASIEKATDGKSKGNVREMHNKSAVGRLDQLAFDDHGKKIEVAAKVVDDAAWKKVEEGVYTGFSIGGAYERRWKDGENTRYTAKPSEISLVDNPCMPDAHFSVIKTDGSTEMRKFTATPPKVGTEVVTKLDETTKAAFLDRGVPEPEQRWWSTDGSGHMQKLDAWKKNEELMKSANDPVVQLRAATALLDASVKKSDSLYDGAASNQPMVPQGHDAVPQVVRDQLEPDALGRLREAIAAVRAHGMKSGEVEVLDMAWGQVVEGFARTPDGKFRVKTDYDTAPDGKSEKAAGADARKKATVAKREFTQEERDKAAKAGTAMADGSYPIENKSDLEDAIQSFGRAKNKKAVKVHIKTRAKELGAEDMLPAPWKDGADKVLVYGELRKGLHAASRLAVIIEDLEYLQRCEELEAATEGDQSTNPQALKQNIASLCATLRSIVEEETNELLDDDESFEFGELLELSTRTRGDDALAKALGDKAPRWLAKLGARHSKADKQRLDTAHEQLSKMGVGCGKAAYSAKDELGKKGARHSAFDREHLTKAHDHMAHAGADCDGMDGVRDRMKPDGADVGESGGDGVKDDDGAQSGTGDNMSPKKLSDGGELTKLLAEEREKTARLEKIVAESAEAVKKATEAIDKRLKHLESLPVARPQERAATLRVVEKSDDDAAMQKARADALEYLERLKQEDPDAFAKAAIQFSLSHPQRMQIGR